MNPTQSWIEVSLSVDPRLLDACGSILCEVTGTGTVIEDADLGVETPSRLKAYLPKDQNLRNRLLAIKEGLSRLYDHFPDSLPPRWELKQIFEENWIENWKRYFQPIRISPRLTVCPLWEDYPAGPGEQVIRLNPGQAFGTGGHASTRICLKAMEALCSEQGGYPLFSRVLDVGTGSGILALAAAVLGAGQVLAIDHDPLAVDSAREHARLNSLEDRIVVQQATPLDVQGPFSLILANLTLDDLTQLSPVLTALLEPGGALLASGFLTRQAKTLVRSFCRQSLALERLLLEEEWAGALFRSP